MNNEKQDLTPNNVSYFSQTVAVTQLVQNPKLQISKHNFRHFILDKHFGLIYCNVGQSSDKDQ